MPQTALLRRKLLRVDFLVFLATQGFVAFVFAQGWLPPSLLAEPGDDFFENHSVLISVHVIAAVLGAIVFMLNFWSPRAHAFLAFSPTNDIFSADHVMVHAEIKKLNKSVTEVVTLNLRAELPDGPRALRRALAKPYFDFQKKRFLWDEETSSFTRYSPSRKLLSTSTIGDFSKLKAGPLEEGPGGVQELLGQRNEFVIPEPSFLEMYKQHVVAPMFVFQILYSFLWLFDQYWKFAFMQLGMLFMFEGTVVMQRRVNLRRIRAIKLPSRQIHVFRDRRWATLDSSELVPGDICALTVQRKKTKKDATKTTSGGEHNIVPCDMALLSGSAIVNESILTGETVPLIKDALALTDLPHEEALSLKKGSHKRHILFGGTELIQSSAGPADLPPPPVDNAAICQVVRTGFETNQGKIIRTMLFNNERVTVESKEAYYFLLILLFFALLAAGYVLNNGLTQYYEYMANPHIQEESGIEPEAEEFLVLDGAEPDTPAVGKKVPSLYKIIYRCVLILTSVVPPELPIQLSLAVNSCLTDLMKRAIFCTEPFRIPLAGRLDVCCFDKTGTLTKDRLKVEGVLLASGVGERAKQGGRYELSSLDELEDDVSSRPALHTLAACHSIVEGDKDEWMGDPIEVASFQGIGWQWSSANDTAKSKKKNTKEVLRLARRFPFSSELKRMTVLARKEGAQGYRALTKGAPEVLADRISDFGGITKPQYTQAYKELMRAGKRVLALAWRPYELGPEQSLFAVERADVERELQFAGFLVMNCPLKKDTRQELELLREAKHKLVMITGDNVLTAAHVAKAVDLNRPPGGEPRSNALFLHVADGGYEWLDYDENVVSRASKPAELDALAGENMLCAEGPQLDGVKDEAAARELFWRITVFARTSPEQKDAIVQRFNERGCVTLMCGDGTNDVGSLKRASVGMALVNRPEAEEKQYFERMAKAGPMGIPPRPANPNAIKRPGFWDIWEQAKKQAQDGQSSGQNPFTAAMQQMNKNISQQREQAKQQDPMSQMFGEKMIVEQGDACIAAPFTYRFSSIRSVTDLIRQGRCTLVTTFQMYRILAISSLMTAYTMSALYLDDDKYGDMQMFILAGVQMVFYFTLAFSKPLTRLAPEKPSSSIFQGPQIVSIAGQFLVHFTSLVVLVSMLAQHGEGTFDNPFLEDPNARVQVEEDSRVFYDTGAETTPEEDLWAMLGSSNFKPSLKNTVLFLYSMVNSTTIFLVNSTGRPFKQGLMDKKGLVYLTIGLYGVAGALALEAVPGLSQWMQLVAFPSSEFALAVFGVLLFNLGGSLLVEAGVRKWEYGRIWFQA